MIQYRLLRRLIMSTNKENTECPFCTYDPSLKYNFSRYYYDNNDKTYVDCLSDNDKVAYLLLDEIIVVLQDKDDHTRTFFAFVVNDTFAYSTSEFIELYSLSEVVNDLFEYWWHDRKWGELKFICIRENKRPVGELVKRMKNDNAWDDTMENLP